MLDISYSIYLAFIVPTLASLVTFAVGKRVRVRGELERVGSVKRAGTLLRDLSITFILVLALGMFLFIGLLPYSYFFLVGPIPFTVVLAAVFMIGQLAYLFFLKIERPLVTIAMLLWLATVASWIAPLASGA